MNRILYIYTLSDCLTGDIKNVGCTLDINYRLRGHRSSDTQVSSWIRSINGNVSIDILDSCSEAEAPFLESFWIQQMQVWGFNMLNKKSTLSNPYKASVYRVPGLKNTGEVWKRHERLYDHGDCGKIARGYNLNVKDVSMVLKRGGRDAQIEKCIMSFFKEKYRSLFGNNKAHLNFYFPKKYQPQD